MTIQANVQIRVNDEGNRGRLDNWLFFQDQIDLIKTITNAA